MFVAGKRNVDAIIAEIEGTNLSSTDCTGAAAADSPRLSGVSSAVHPAPQLLTKKNGFEPFSKESMYSCEK